MEIIPLCAGCMLHGDNIDDNRSRARSGWELCRTVIAEGRFDIVILDEVTLPVGRGWIDISDLIETVNNRPRGTHVVVTGRNASAEMVAAADLVTEMRVIKHPLHEQGIRAQIGIDR